MTQTEHPVDFKGTGKDFFGIWISNLLLTIVTFGIYAAWAKVRKRKYFAQSTSIAERNFDYHATGKQIFIGYLIVFAAYFVFNIVIAIVPFLSILFLGIFFVIPYLLKRALAFNARMTSYSGVRFRFDGDYWGAFRNFMLYPFLAFFTLFLAMPWVARANRRYVTNGHSLGTSRFSFDSEMSPFLKAFGYALLWAVGSAIVLGLATGVGGRFMAFAENPEDPQALIGFMIVYVVILAAVLPAAFIYQAYLRNAIYAGSALEGGHTFKSTVKPATLMWIAVSNALLTAITLGLYSPFAQVRMMKYLADNTFVYVGGSLDDFIAAEAEKQSALGDAFADIEGIDLGVAI